MLRGYITREVAASELETVLNPFDYSLTVVPAGFSPGEGFVVDDTTVVTQGGRMWITQANLHAFLRHRAFCERMAEEDRRILAMTDEERQSLIKPLRTEK